MLRLRVSFWSYRRGWTGEHAAPTEPAGHGSEPAWALQTVGHSPTMRISPLQAIDSSAVLTYSEALAVTLIVLICALGVAILTAAVSAFAVWRVRNSADQRVADAVQQLAAGMQET